MKKHTNHLKIICLAFLTIVAISFSACKKDDPTPTPTTYAEENPLAGFISQAGLSKTDTFINQGYYEFGLQFKPTVTGKINSLVVQLPASNTSVLVTLWDSTTKTVVYSQTINDVVANVSKTVATSGWPLVKDKNYMLTMNSNDWYNRTRTVAPATITYPYTVGNIIINRYGYTSGSSQTFPTQFPTTYYAGDVSFNFQRTE